MTQQKADFVYAVFVDAPRKFILLFESRQHGGWTIPGGVVRPSESEEDAAQRYAEEVVLTDSEVFVLGPLGPAQILPDGKVAKAFLCILNGEPGIRDECDTYAQCALVNRDDVLTSIRMDHAITERMIWDALSVSEEVRTLPKQVGFEVEGHFCDPGKEHILVRETENERFEWPRLNPKDGQPMPAS